VTRILVLCSTLGVGGRERQLALLLPELKALGFDPYVATLRHRGRYFEALEQQGVTMRFIGMRSRGDLRGIARAYSLWRVKPEIVLTSSVDAQVIGELVAARAGAFHVTVEHGGAGLPRAVHRRLLVRAVAPRVDRVVAVSTTQLEELRKLGFPADRITVIPNGIPPPIPTRPRRAVRAEFGLGEDDVVALLVATLRPEKRADAFVEALRFAHAGDARVRGLIAGGGPGLESVRSLAAEAPDVVRVLGQRDDIADLITASDVVCLTSTFEGLPMTVLEAMALSRPVVATKVGGIPDAVTDGRTGRLVAPGDTAAFAEALVELASEPGLRGAMGEAANVAYRERYTLTSMAERYRDILSELVQSRGDRTARSGSSPGGERRLRRTPLSETRAAKLAAAALSRGPGYEPQPLGQRFEADQIRGYYLDFSAKTTSPTAEDPKRLVPAGLAQLALGWWERSLAGEEAALDAFDGICGLLLERAVTQGDSLVWRYDMAVPKYGLRPPWFSAMAQGQIASVFARAATRDEAAAEWALRALRPLLDRAAPFVVEGKAGPVLEEAPSTPRSQVLNGWIYALWGVHDVAVGLGSAEAAALFDESLGSLRATLDEYDTGWWSRYSLWAGGRDLAKPFYHRIHIVQFEALHKLTGVDEFAAVAARWRKYDTHKAAARAVLAKAREVVAR
jgi:glycosyltransferase involved in cell wall biosynthesis